ncbi:MAG: hypothetical protein HDQ87_08320 [Clostridia bacterium]|nr:hypothetical protein [Clostridia bacterium]
MTMKSLLSQNWFVARSSVLLWLCCAAAFVITFFVIADNGDSQIIPGLGLVYAFFAAVYLGDAGTSGRLDGQVIHGSARFRIYLAHFITLFVCFLLILFCTLLGELAAYAVNGAFFDMSGPGLLLDTAGLLLNAAGYAAMYALIGLLTVGRRPGRGTVLLIVCVSLVLALAIWGSVIMDRLAQPEYDMVIRTGFNTEIAWYGDDYPDGVEAEKVPNPYYVAEPERSRLESLTRFIPVTQCIVLHSFLDMEPTADAAGIAGEIYLYSALLTAVCSAAGIALFQRRELD